MHIYSMCDFSIHIYWIQHSTPSFIQVQWCQVTEYGEQLADIE